MNWKRLSTPLKIGVIAAALGVALAVIGILRGTVPANFLSIVLALLISGLSWGVVAWAIATAAADVEHDLAEGEDGDDAIGATE
jgi:multisubunit Na+/H+ antiporter MnhG subunit